VGFSQRFPSLKKKGQGGFEAFLNPPKSPFSKGGLVSASYRLMPMGGMTLRNFPDIKSPNFTLVYITYDR
jgi:hypothetical protein